MSHDPRPIPTASPLVDGLMTRHQQIFSGEKEFLEHVSGIDPTAAQHFVTKTFADGQYINVDGSVPLQADWSAGSFQATNLGTVMVQTIAPTSPADGQLWLDTSVTGVSNEYLQVVEKTTTYTFLLTDDLVLCDATGGAFTLTVPTAVGNEGKVFRAKKIDATANAITISGSENIDESASQSLASQYDAITFVSDNVEWWLL